MSGEGDLDLRLCGRAGALALDVAFVVPACGVSALYGPSGVGKTTLLRAIAGLERLTGHVRFRGEAWQDQGRFVPPWRRPIGFVFQDAALLPHLSVRGNLDYAVRRAETGRSRIGFEAAVDLLGLAPLLDRSPDRLSGGEGRRVAIGRALLTQPELLLLDEPTAGLDGAARDEVLSRLKRLTQTVEMPTLLVSHDPGEILRLADRAVAMRDGAAAPPASPGEVLTATAARAELTDAEPERRDRLALAALLAGLPPA